MECWGASLQFGSGRPQPVQRLKQNILYSLSSSYIEISIYEFASPFLSFSVWGLVPVGRTDGVSEKEFCWTSDSGSCVDINGAADPPTEENSWRVDPSLCLSGSPPPLLLLHPVPLQHSSPSFSSKAGVRRRKELSGTDLLQRTVKTGESMKTTCWSREDPQ